MLRSFRVAYDREQDRILLLLASDDEHDHALWLSRRFLRELWPVLIKALSAGSRIGHQAKGPFGHEVLAFEREVALQRARLTPEDRARAAGHTAEAGTSATEPRPAKEGPRPRRSMVAVSASVRAAPGRPTAFTFGTADRRRFTFTLDLDNLHLFAELLHQAVSRSEWDLSLHVPWESSRQSSSA